MTADETQVPVGTNVDVTADVGDAEEVTLWVLDADDVTVTDGDVTFEANDDGDFDAALGSATITGIDGVAVPAATSRTVDVTDGVVEAVVNAGTAEEFVVLVAETDGTAPELDADGAPVEDFGVTMTITAQDVGGIALVDADRTTTTVFGVPDVSVRPEGETVNVTAILFDAVPDLTDADAISDAVVPVDGDITYVVADNDGDPYSAADGPDDVLTGDVVASGTATVADGVVGFSFTGGDAGDEYIIVAEWDAVEDGAYDGLSVETFVTDNHGEIDFVDADPIGTTASFVDADDQLVEVDGTATVQVEVLDQFGNPASGVDVEFDTDGTGDFIRTTNASGVASFAFSESANGVVTVTADIAAETDVTDAIPIAADVDVYFYDEAAADDNTADSVIVSADTDADTILVDDGGVFLLFDYSIAAVYQIDAGNVLETAFEDFLDDDLNAGTDTLTVTDADVDADPTTFNIADL